MQEIHKAQQNGTLSGIHGRLGDLGQIDGKYDVAISTAAPQLDFIVVNEVEEAEACMTFLRNNSIGRATFIVLAKMK